MLVRRLLAWLAHVLPWYDVAKHDAKQAWTNKVVAASRARRRSGETTMREAYRAADAARRKRHP